MIARRQHEQRHMPPYSIDRYMVDTLMPDLVGHDRQPSAFLVYLYLWCRSGGRRRKQVTASLQEIALDTGLSKSAVQQAVRTLKRRRLLQSHQSSVTAVPLYALATPWTRRPAQPG
jgi:DNA-binding MarR family transcriptional regulator